MRLIVFSPLQSSHADPRNPRRFTFVDFGSGANIFLRSLGVKDEPSPADVAALLVNEPQHFLKLAGTSEAYVHLSAISMSTGPDLHLSLQRPATSTSFGTSVPTSRGSLDLLSRP